MASKATIDSDVTLASDLSTLLSTAIDTTDTYADVLNMSITSTGYTAGQSDERVTEEWGMTVNAAIRAMWPQAKLVYDNFTDSGSAVSCSVPFSASTLTATTYVDIGGVRHYSGSGSPDGSLSANEGSIYVDEDTGDRYRNTSTGSGTTWTSLEKRWFTIYRHMNYTGSGSTLYWDFYHTSGAQLASADESELYLNDGVITRISLKSASAINITWGARINGAASFTSESNQAFTAGERRTLTPNESVSEGDELQVSIFAHSAGTDYWLTVEGYSLA